MDPTRRTLAVCALASFLAGLSGSILFVVLPGVGAEFHAGVDQLAQLGATLSLGSALALPLAALADRGRRGPVAAFGVAGFALASLASAVAPGLPALAGARLLAVCCEALVLALTTAAALEVVSARKRGQAASLLALSAGAGGAVSVAAYPWLAPHWRVLYLVAAAALPLSPLMLAIPTRVVSAKRSGAVMLLLQPRWRLRFTVLLASALLGALLYEPANFFAVFFGSRSLALTPLWLSAVVAVSGLAAAVGYVVAGVLSDRVGRRLPGVALAVLSTLLTAVSFTRSLLLYVAGNILWSGLAGAAGPIISAWLAELMPTRARVTAFTADAVAGAVGGVVGLLVVALLAPRIGLGASVRLLAVAAAVGAAALLILPETRGVDLPD